jgi:hypothetical protein
MAWNTTMVTMTRVLISDLATPYKYSDERLEQLIVVAAKYVQQDIYGFTDYTVTIDTPDISPDPTVGNDKNDAFVNFTVLKAACIADQSTFRSEALKEGIRVNCGPAAIAVGGRLKGFQTLLEMGPCAAYDEMRTDYIFGNISIQAILTPFVSNDFDPSNLLHRSL